MLCASNGIATAKDMLPKADLVGAGSTFSAPIYQRWIEEFSGKNPGFSLFYDPVGSGEGTKRFIAGQVDFGASDSAMSDEQIAKVENGVQLIPATAGIVVLAYNIPKIHGQLRLSRDVYSDIFLGKIKNWNDPRIAALNPGLNLPNLNIITITRTDASGTTWAFTNHLNAISKAWRETGSGAVKKMDWPGTSMSANYNEGVSAKIKVSWGGIGYVEYGIAKRAGLEMAALENKEGHFISPSDESGTITLANTSAEIPANLRMFFPDPAGKDSYPIITYSWLLLYKSYPEKKQAERVKEFVKWGLAEGQKYAAVYGYAALPQPVVSKALEALGNVH